jgi:lipooligosaccharide transport system permease protein
MSPSKSAPAVRLLPPLARRLYAVWFRHTTVYNRHFITNSFVTVLDPLVFFAAVGWGLASSIGRMDGLDYLSFLVPAQLMIAVVYTSAFETSFGTYFRLEMDHNYDSMAVTPVSPREIFWGELLYIGTRAAFFTLVLLGVFTAFGLVASPWALAAPLVGFFTAISVGSLGFFATRLARTINHFNYFITGVVSPLILFSGTLFPIDRLPKAVGAVAAWMPLYPSVNLCRMLVTGRFHGGLAVCLAYVVLAPWVLGFFAVRVMVPKVIR